MIWDYEPDYKSLEEPKADNVMISTVKDMEQVVKPYKLIYQQEAELLGTVSNIAIEQLLASFKSIELDEILYNRGDLEADDVNQILKQPNHVTLFFATDVPLEVFGSLFNMSTKNLPNATFNRLVVNLNNVATANEVEFLFISSTNKTIYRAAVDAEDAAEVNKVLQGQLGNMFVYNEFVREQEL